MGRAHLYEYRADRRKLKCSCGWEKTLANSDPRLVASTFEEHREGEALKAA